MQFGQLKRREFITLFGVVTWNAFFLPKGAPSQVVKKLNDATSQAIDTPAIKSRLHELGVTVVALERRSPEYLTKFVVAVPLPHNSAHRVHVLIRGQYVLAALEARGQDSVQNSPSCVT